MGKEHDMDLTYVRDYNVCWAKSTHGSARTGWNDLYVMTESSSFHWWDLTAVLQWWCNTDSDQKRALSTSGGLLGVGGCNREGAFEQVNGVISERVYWLENLFGWIKYPESWRNVEGEKTMQRGKRESTRVCTSPAQHIAYRWGWLWAQHITAPLELLSGSQ